MGTGKERFRFAVVVAGLILISNWLGNNFLVEPAAKWYHDLQLRRRAKVQERHTRIVSIDSADHERIFGGRSPLPGMAVIQAACAVAARGPAVVAVDLDTSSPHEFPEGFRLPKTPVPIVWAVDFAEDAEGHGSSGGKADLILGGRLPGPLLYGIVAMPADFDGVVRFWKHFEMMDNYPRPTLPWEAVRQYCKSRSGSCPAYQEEKVETHPPALMTDVRFQTIRLSEFLPDAPRQFPSACPTLPPDPRLKDRIVVLGGSYSRTDLHETPWGSRQGAELVAMAIEQVFDPTPLHDVAEYANVILEIAIALLIGAIHHWIRPIPATLFTLILLSMGIIVSAELVFLFGDFEVGIVPFMVGVWIHQLVGSAERAERLTHQAETLAQQLERAKAAGWTG